MCLAVPGRIKKINGNDVVIDYGVEQRTAKILTDEYKEGDYVVVQAGIILMKVPEREAKDALKNYKDSVC